MIDMREELIEGLSLFLALFWINLLIFIQRFKIVTFNVVAIQKILPHRYPFLLLDRVISIEEGKYIEAYKNVSISEPVFQGHFPNHPIYPGVMIIEGLAQAGGVLAFQSASDKEQKDIENKVVYFMSIE